MGSGQSAPWQNLVGFASFLALQAWAPFLIILVTGSRRLRSVTPIVLAGLLVFSFSNLLLTDLFVFSLEFATVRDKLPLIGAQATLIVWFMLAAVPVGYLCWTGIRLLNHAYERRAFSDIQLVIDSWWLIAVSFAITLLAGDWGWGSLAALLAFAVYRGTVAVGLLLCAWARRRSAGAGCCCCGYSASNGARSACSTSWRNPGGSSATSS